MAEHRSRHGSAVGSCVLGNGPSAQDDPPSPSPPPPISALSFRHSLWQGCRVQGRSWGCGSAQGTPGCAEQKRYRRWRPGPQEAEHSLHGVQGVQGPSTARGMGCQHEPTHSIGLGMGGMTGNLLWGRSSRFGADSSLLGQTLPCGGRSPPSGVTFSLFGYICPL